MEPPSRFKFAHLPTPVESLPRLSAFLSGPKIFVKRDDRTGLTFGGNKVRKLEFLLAEAQAGGARTLISAGAIQSNHCRQTAAAAAKFGFDIILVLTGERPGQPTSNLLMDQLFGAEIIWVADRADRDRVLQRAYDEAVDMGKCPYLVPYGGSSPIGVLGYVYAMEEFVGQDVEADWIIIASSSGGTHAGLVLGQQLFDYPGKVLGISIDESEDTLKARVSRLASDTSERLGKRIQFAPDDIWAKDDYCQAGYGVLTDAEREAITLFAKLEGLLLDPVYTGRAAAGMIDLIRNGFFGKDNTILFWHTGGQPALFADGYQAHLLEKI
jgi:D-cysteine desulfhydrase family pyridoxal phosphate-dependent enzyme